MVCTCVSHGGGLPIAALLETMNFRGSGSVLRVFGLTRSIGIGGAGLGGIMKEGLTTHILGA